MKLTKYIKQLQDLHRQYGNADVKFYTAYELENSEYEDVYTKAFKPYYSKGNHCIVVHEDFVRYDD